MNYQHVHYYAEVTDCSQQKRTACHMDSPRAWHSVWNGDRASLHENRKSQPERLPASRGHFNTLVEHSEICFTKFLFPKPNYLRFYRMEEIIEFIFVYFSGKLTFTLNYTNPVIYTVLIVFLKLPGTHHQPVTAICITVILLFVIQYFKVIYNINPVSYFIRLPFSSTKKCYVDLLRLQL